VNPKRAGEESHHHTPQFTIRGFEIARDGSTSLDTHAWNDLVARSEGGTAFHRVEWLQVMAQTLGHAAVALEARDSTGALCAALPLVRVTSRLFGSYLVAVPFASYGGPVGDPAGVDALAIHAITEATRRRAALLELRARTPLATTPNGFVVSNRKLTVTLSLEGGAAEVFKRFSAKLRSQIRRSEKDGVVVRVAPQQPSEFHRVYTEHMRDLGTPALPRRFFESLAARFGDDMLFAIASLNGVPIACGAGFRYRDEFEITWASALRAYNRLSPNMAMYWQLMAHLAESGVRTFNFGRCSADSGTHRFKRQWGGDDEVLHWYQWRAAGAPEATPAPGGRLSLAQALWTRLPLSVANVLGPRLARLLP
jgi:serine/alanine adding enzyme